MPWPKPNFDEWVAEFKAIWAALRPTADSTKGSDAWLYQHTLGHATTALQEMIDRGLARLSPTTSSGIHLDRLLFAHGRPDGLGSYGLIKAHVSSGTDALAVVFTGVAEINPTHELTDDAGRRYRINEVYNWPGPGGTTYNADVISIDTGLETNLEVGEVLHFTNPPANVNTEATIVVDLDFGRALEEDDSGRAALIEKLQKPSLSGNWAQWKRWVEEAVPGNLDAWIWPTRNNGPYGFGCVDYTATQRSEVGAARIWSTAQKTAVQTYLAGDAESPDLLIKESRALTLDDQPRAFVYTFKLSESAPDANRCDWDAYAEKRTITAIDKPTKLITVNAVYTTGPQIGDKVFIAGYEATVVLQPGNAAVPVSGSMLKFTVSTWPSHWDTIDLTDIGDGSAAGFSVCSGGGIVPTVFQAIEAYANGIDGASPAGRGNLPKLGPAQGTWAAPITGWDDTFRIDMIKSAAAIAAGGWIVSHSECKIGGVAADAGPTYGITATVEIMTAVEIAVYEDKT